MSDLFTRSYIGGKDLYFGIPDLKDAKIIDVINSKTCDDYVTELVIEGVNGKVHKIIVMQEI